MPERVVLTLSCGFCAKPVELRYLPEPELVDPVTVSYKCPHCEALQPVFGLYGRIVSVLVVRS